MLDLPVKCVRTRSGPYVASTYVGGTRVWATGDSRREALANLDDVLFALFGYTPSED
jgi:predicted RNase H-like HicB family nuclease